MPRSPIPQWFPARETIIVLGLAAVLAVPAAVFTFLERSSMQKVGEVENLAAARQALLPSVSSVRAQAAKLKKIVGSSAALSKPKDLFSLLLALERLAEDAGIRDSHFLPAAESVVGAGETLRLDGGFTAAPDSFRRFILLLGDQEWVASINGITEISREPVPEFTMTLRASCTELSGKRSGAAQGAQGGNGGARR